jgi:phage-related protein
MATDVGSARVEVTGDVRSFARQTERDLNRALSNVRVDPVPITADVKGIRDELDRVVADAGPAGQRAGDRFGESAGRALAPSFERNTDGNRIRSGLSGLFARAGVEAVKFMVAPLSGALATLPKLVLPGLIVAAIGIATAIATVATPVLGSLLGAAVIAAGSLAIIGLGAFLLREQPQVVRAASRMVDSVREVFQRAARPLIQPLVDSLTIFGNAAERLAPQFNSIFSTISSAVVPLAQGLILLVENALPGFNEFIAAAEPFLRSFAASLPALGAAFGNFFGSISDAGPELTEFFEDFIGWLGRFIEWLGTTIGSLARAYVAIKEFLGPLPEILREAWDAFRDGASAGEIFDILEQAFDPGFFDRVVASIRNVVTSGLNYLAENGPAIVQGILDMRATVFDAAIELFMGIVDALPAIIPQVVSGLVSMVTTLVDTLVEAVPQLVEAAGQLVTSLVEGITAALPDVIQGATQIVLSLLRGIVDLIPVIIEAGLELAKGLVEGVMTALPELQKAFIEILPQLVKSLNQITPDVLLLGLNLLTTLVQGIAEGLPQLIETVQTQVIPALIDTLTNEGPRLIEQGGQALTQFLQGMVDSIGLIAEVITNQIIPAITTLLEENPELIEAGVGVITTLIDAWVDNVDMVTSFITDTFIPAITTVIIENLPALIDAGVKILIAVMNGMIQATPQITGAIVGRVIPAMVSALLQAVPQMVSAGNRIVTALVGSIASAWLSQNVKAMGAIRNGIVNFFSGAGSWLVSAGRQIIEGLLSGIRAMIPSLQGLLGSITSMLPSWKGPEEVDRSILEPSGRMVMQGFGRGIQAERDNIRRQLQDFTGDLPSFTAGVVRGGDGAAAGGMVVNFEPGSVQITGQGAEAGEEAAEAIFDRLAQAKGMM